MTKTTKPWKTPITQAQCELVAWWQKRQAEEDVRRERLLLTMAQRLDEEVRYGEVLFQHGTETCPHCDCRWVLNRSHGFDDLYRCFACQAQWRKEWRKHD